MFISKNIMASILLATSAVVSFCSEEPQTISKKQETIHLSQPSAVDQIHHELNKIAVKSETGELLYLFGAAYDNYARKINFMCNPIGLTTATVVSSLLGTKRLLLVAFGGAILANAHEIKKYIDHNLEENRKKEELLKKK